MGMAGYTDSRGTIEQFRREKCGKLIYFVWGIYSDIRSGLGLKY
jgi:hypothetical protein